MDKEREETLKRWAIRSYRIDQFMWGWCWAMCVALGFKLAEEPGWFVLATFVLNAVLGCHFGRKTKISLD